MPGVDWAKWPLPWLNCMPICIPRRIAISRPALPNWARCSNCKPAGSCGRYSGAGEAAGIGCCAGICIRGGGAVRGARWCADLPGGGFLCVAVCPEDVACFLVRRVCSDCERPYPYCCKQRRFRNGRESRSRHLPVSLDFRDSDSLPKLLA